jgi:hypothetical protein
MVVTARTPALPACSVPGLKELACLPACLLPPSQHASCVGPACKLFACLLPPSQHASCVDHSTSRQHHHLLTPPTHDHHTTATAGGHARRCMYNMQPMVHTHKERWAPATHPTMQPPDHIQVAAVSVGWSAASKHRTAAEQDGVRVPVDIHQACSHNTLRTGCNY